MDSEGIDAGETALTDRQVTVLRRREGGRTQQEIATELGTTASNVSAIERAARENVAKARRTLDLVRVIRAPARIRIERGTPIEEIVDAIYAEGDARGIKISYPHPELYSHLYTQLKAAFDEGKLQNSIEIGITREGRVRTHAE